jgi:hypothetical protein
MYTRKERSELVKNWLLHGVCSFGGSCYLNWNIAHKSHGCSKCNEGIHNEDMKWMHYKIQLIQNHSVGDEGISLRHCSACDVMMVVSPNPRYLVIVWDGVSWSEGMCMKRRLPTGKVCEVS